MELPELMHFLISTVLSYGVVVGASILKVPQIVNILRHQSADGVSLVAAMFETLAVCINTSWGIMQGLSFKDYGENMLILLQMVAMLVLIGFFQGTMSQSLAILGVEGFLLYALSTGMVPRHIHEVLLGSLFLLSLSSRVPQIYMNYRNRATGKLSFLSFFLATGGGCARILTTSLNVPWESGKLLMMLQLGLAASLNTIIMWQIFVYRHNKKPVATPSALKPSSKRTGSQSSRPAGGKKANPRTSSKKRN